MSLEEDETGSIPSVVYVKKSSTLLCRWDAGCADHASPSVSDREEASLELSPPLAGGGDVNLSHVPVRSPSSRSPRTSCGVTKQREKSLQSGIAIGSITLEPVSLPLKDGVSPAFKSLLLDRSPMSKILKLNRGNGEKMTVVFCIRRPGCGSCRDHGMQLARLARNMDFEFDLFGIIKDDPGIDDKSLFEFIEDYFPFPLYKDTNRDVFRFLGDRNLSVWELLRGHAKLSRRFAELGIKNIPFGGDLFTQGGILFFDKKGQLRHIYYERYGDELDTDAVKWAIEDSRKKVKKECPPQSPIRSPSKSGDKEKFVIETPILASSPRLPIRTTSIH